MKLLLSFLFCFILFSQTLAQEIKVLHADTKEPVAGVAVYNQNKTKSALTNFDGMVNISHFSNTDIIFFQHLSFVILQRPKASIVAKKPILLFPNSRGLDEVVISASKFKQSKKDVPQKISSVTAKTIQFTNPQTSADVLAQAGTVYIQKSQLGGGSPMIRGFSTNRLLINVDGVRMNNAIFRGGNVQNVIAVDPFTLANTEVILGAGSVIYGSDAIGGVMSFYTKKPKLSYSQQSKFHANSTVRYATASNEKTGQANFNFGFKKWASFTNFSYTSFGDLKMGKHGPKAYLRPEYVTTNNGEDVVVTNKNPRVQKFSGYNQFNILQKFRYEPKDQIDLDLSFYFSQTSNYPRYDRLLRYRNNTLQYAKWDYGPQRWFMANFGFTKLSSKSNLYDKIKVIAAYQNFQESRIDRNYQSVLQQKTQEQVDAYSANFDFEKKLNDKAEVFYGAEYIFNRVNAKASIKNIETNITNPTVTRYPNQASWQSAAAYTSLKYKANTRFVLQSGLRYNLVHYQANFKANNAFLNLPFSSTSNTTDAFTGTLGFIWNANKTISWKWNASTAFRAPNIDDVGKVFDSEPGSVVVPNNNLKPEYAYGIDAGLQLNFSQKLILNFATFYTFLDNALVRRNYTLNGQNQIVYQGELSTIQAIQNASEAKIYGFEVGLEIPISKNIKWTTQYNILGGTEVIQGKAQPVRHIAPYFGNSSLLWKKNKLTVETSLIYNNELTNNKLAASEQAKDYLYALDANGKPYAPSWYTLNFRAQYKVNPKLEVTANIENITNQRYRPYSSGISAPGINFIGVIQYSL